MKCVLKGAHECQRDAVLRDGGVCFFLGRWNFNCLKLGPYIGLYKNPVSTAEKYNE